MNKELTFSEMVNEAIEAKQALGTWFKTILPEEASFIRPAEAISKLGKNPEHSGEESWRIASALKKLGLTRRGLADYHWETPGLAETIPLGKAHEAEKGQIPLYIVRIDEALDQLVKWCSNLSFADRNKEEEEFYTRSMKAGERLLKVKSELREELS